MNEPSIARADEAAIAELIGHRARDRESAELYAYLAASAPGGVWIARDGDAIIGVAIVHANDDDAQLAELFVEPGFRRIGLAGKLARAASEAVADLTRSAVAPASETGALAWLMRHGVAPHTPVFEISGKLPKSIDLMRLAAGDYHFTTEPLDAAAHGGAIDALDREVRGSVRPDDHVFMLSRGLGIAFFLAGEFVGYAYVMPDGRVGPLAAASPAYLVQFLAYAMHMASERLHASWVSVLAPGESMRAARALIRQGLDIRGQFIYAGEAPRPEFGRYLGYRPALF